MSGCNMKNLEAHLRRVLTNQGMILQKSHARTTMNINDHGGYRIIDMNNCIIAGEKFDLNLDDVMRFTYE